MNEESRKAGNADDQTALASSDSIPAFLLSSFIQKPKVRQSGFMNEEGRKAGKADEQTARSASDIIPDYQPPSSNPENMKPGEMELEDLTGRVIGCAIAVHRELGPGFLECIYENALSVELRHAGISFLSQGEKPILHRGELIGVHRFDLLVGGQLVLELKAIKSLEDIHFAQVRSYLKALNLKHGLLLISPPCPSR